MRLSFGLARGLERIDVCFWPFVAVKFSSACLFWRLLEAPSLAESIAMKCANRHRCRIVLNFQRGLYVRGHSDAYFINTIYFFSQTSIRRENQLQASGRRLAYGGNRSCPVIDLACQRLSDRSKTLDKHPGKRSNRQTLPLFLWNSALG